MMRSVEHRPLPDPCGLGPLAGGHPGRNYLSQASLRLVIAGASPGEADTIQLYPRGAQVLALRYGPVPGIPGGLVGLRLAKSYQGVSGGSVCVAAAETSRIGLPQRNQVVRPPSHGPLVIP